MIVSSPIGELPFAPERLSYQARGLSLEGKMGAWPATVQIGIDDAPAVLRLIARPVAVGVAAAAAVALLRGLIRSTSPN